MKTRKKCWSWHFGPRGHRWTVCEDSPGSNLYLAQPKSKVYRSLEHKDRERAKEQCREASLAHQAYNEPVSEVPTLGLLIDLYLDQKSKVKVQSEQDADQRRAAMWKTILPEKSDVRKVDWERVWDDFISSRGSGSINPEGDPVPADHRRTVRTATVAGDLIFINTVLNFAAKKRIEGSSKFYLDFNPAKGCKIPKEKNPLRPLVTADRFEKVREASESPKISPSYLPEVLDLAHESGRRISAILGLRYEDLRLDLGPNGSICWPSWSDKRKKEWTAPLSKGGREAIDRVLSSRPGIGKAFLFPDPRDGTKPVSRYVMDRLLIEAEQLAGVPHLRGGLWHPYRRGWATARKHLPAHDVAAAGGWSEVASLQASYQMADFETMQAVVDNSQEKEA